jgi:sugar/nucleoside kinase (ribokinase family)
LTSPTFDVVAIGNAIVDILAHSTDEFLAAEGMTKGSMALIFDPAAADDLYSRMGPGSEVSGGSAANTIAGLAALGHPTGFIGQVADDQLGKVFAHDVQSLGVHFATPAKAGGDPTARCLVLITPDGQRTMNTFLGAAQFLPEAAVDPETIEAGAILYLEGYLWNAEQSRDAMKRAIALARGAGRKVALTLSDVFVIEGHREEFFELIDGGQIDLLFANDNEVRAMMQTEDVVAAVKALAARVPLLVCTHGPAGAEAHSGDEHARVPAEPIDKVVDTTGAGDLFAAGFLAGQAQGRDLETSLRMGAICAAECISHIGPRPVADIKALVEEKLSPVGNGKRGG